MCISEKRIRLLQSVDKAEPGSCRDFVVLRRGCFVVLAIKSFFENCPGGQEDGNFSEPSFKDVTIELTNFEDASGS